VTCPLTPRSTRTRADVPPYAWVAGRAPVTGNVSWHEQNLMDLIERYWYLILGAVIGVTALWLVLGGRRKEGQTRISSLFMFGPFGPNVDRYLAKRGGLTKREWFGWGIVVLVAVLAIIFTPATRGA